MVLGGVRVEGNYIKKGVHRVGGCEDKQKFVCVLYMYVSTYERFYGRWKRVYLGTADGEEKDTVFGGHFLNPVEM